MPRENRKRGKKHKSSKSVGAVPEAPEIPEPSPAVDVELHPATSDSPFGYVDPELKSYFKSIDHKLREWLATSQLGPAGDQELEQEQRLFFAAALKEMRGHELQLATDPECSAIVEGMLHSMDTFSLRVFLDTIAGSYRQLSIHRFGSHVCQTGLYVAATKPPNENPDNEIDVARGLRPLSRLIVDAAKEITPHTSELLSDQFGSHVLRALVIILRPSLGEGDPAQNSGMRSKKSAAWRGRHGEYTSLFGDAPDWTNIPANVLDSDGLLKSILLNALSVLTDAEIRALSINPASSPTLQLLVKAESSLAMSDQPGSLMDSVLDGLISRTTQNPSSDFVRTLIRDETASHLLEAIIESCSVATRYAIWKEYFAGHLNKLALHPVANFLVARFLRHHSARHLSDALHELVAIFPKLVKTARSGVLISAASRVNDLDDSHSVDLMDALFAAFGFKGGANPKLLVYSIIGLHITDTKPEPTTPGAILLQTMLKVREPLHQHLIDGILSLPIDAMLDFACHPTSSRVIDVFLDSPTVAHKAKRQLLLNFIGHYHLLAADRIGSRIVDRCWGFADGYMKEKIARSVAIHELSLLQSSYGKYFMRHLNLPLLRTRPADWKKRQATPINVPQKATGKRKRVNDVP